MVEEPSRDKEKISAAWVEFLSRYDFDGWGTATFRVPARSSYMAMKRVARVIRHYGRKCRPEPWFFVVAEPFNLGSYHCHFLICSEAGDELKRASFFRGLKDSLERGCGFSKVGEMRDKEDVYGYVSKYLVKHDPEFRFVGLRRHGKQRRQAGALVGRPGNVE